MWFYVFLGHIRNNVWILRIFAYFVNALKQDGGLRNLNSNSNLISGLTESARMKNILQSYIKVRWTIIHLSM